MINRHKASENWIFSPLIHLIKEHIPFEEFEKTQSYYPGYALEKGGVNGWTALAMAAKEGKLEFVHKILKASNSQLIHLETASGFTPLHCTALCQKKKNGLMIAKLLIEKGANVHLAAEMNGERTSPLLSSLKTSKNFALTKLLLWHQARLNSAETLNEEAQESFMAAEKWVEEKKSKLIFDSFLLQSSDEVAFRLCQDVIQMIIKKAFLIQEQEILKEAPSD